MAPVRTTEGPFVGKLKRAIEKITHDRRLKKFELRSIRVESLHLFALWLKNKNGEDLFVPVNALGNRLKPGRRYTEEEFVAGVLPEGARVRDAHLRVSQSR